MFFVVLKNIHGIKFRTQIWNLNVMVISTTHVAHPGWLMKLTCGYDGWTSNSITSISTQWPSLFIGGQADQTFYEYSHSLVESIGLTSAQI